MEVSIQFQTILVNQNYVVTISLAKSLNGLIFKILKDNLQKLIIILQKNYLIH